MSYTRSTEILKLARNSEKGFWQRNKKNHDWEKSCSMCTSTANASRRNVVHFTGKWFCCCAFETATGFSNKEQ